MSTLKNILHSKLFIGLSICVFFIAFLAYNTNIYAFGFIITILSYFSSLSVYFFYNVYILNNGDNHQKILAATCFLCAVPLLSICLISETSSKKLNREITTYIWEYNCKDTGKDISKSPLVICQNGQKLTVKEIIAKIKARERIREISFTNLNPDDY